MNKNTNIFVVTHTHWDREWYMSFEQFRMRLVEVINLLLDQFDSDEDFKHLHFDGQTIFINDYLEICPQNEKRLRANIKNGKIAIGPWYVLPDGFSVCSENFIRNLLLGHKICSEYETFPKIAYLPDTFGYPSQMPQILKGFGLDCAVIWRGLSGEKLKTELEWESPDKSVIKVIHLPDEYGYLNMRDVPRDGDYKSLYETIEKYLKNSTGNNVLLMNGFDHQIPQFYVGKEIKKLSESLKIKHSSLQEYADSVFGQDCKLQRVYGELTNVNQNPNANTNAVLRNCLSSRNDIKVKYFHTTENILRFSEPLTVMAMMLGKKSYGDFLTRAWKYILQNDAHDSICGCSVNTVNRDVSVRLDWANEIASQLNKEAIFGIVDANGCMADENEKCIPIYIFNTLLYDRTGVFEIEFEIPKGEFFRNIKITDLNNNKLNMQVIDITDCGVVDNIISHEISWHDCRKIKVAVETTVPSFGYSVVLAKITHLPQRNIYDLISSSYGVLENEFIYAKIMPNGAIDITDKKSGKKLFNVNYFKDSGDVGDVYIYSPPHIDSVRTTLYSAPEIKLVENGELKAVYLVEYKCSAPETFDECRASEKSVVNTIKSYVTLYKNEKILRFRTIVENNSKQHRLRACFPTGGHDKTVLADSHFDIVERSIRGNDVPDDALIESPYDCGAQKRFIIYSGMFVLNKGLQEYEITESSSGNVAEVTLLRCVQKIGQGNSLKTTVMPGPFCIESTDAQCIGIYEFEYAVGLDTENVNIIAEKYLCDCIGFADNEKNSAAICEQSLLKVDNTKIRVSALKKAVDSNDCILRMYNPWNTHEIVNIHGNVSQASVVNLKEEEEAKLQVVDGSVKIILEPKKIITIKLKVVQNNQIGITE